MYLHVREHGTWLTHLVNSLQKNAAKRSSKKIYEEKELEFDTVLHPRFSRTVTTNNSSTMALEPTEEKS